MICPKCGFAEASGEECPSCGVILRKVRAAPAPPPEEARPEDRRGRMLPLLGLAVSAAALVLVLRGQAPRAPEPPLPAAGRVARAPAPEREADPEPTPEPTLPPFTTMRPVPAVRPESAAPPAVPAVADERELARERRVHAPASGWYEGADGFRAAEEERERWGKPMAVYFHTDWCGYCRKLDADILSAPAASEYLDTIAKVKLNPERSPEERALAQRFGVRGFPSFFIVPATGGGGRMVHPFTRQGAMTPEQFVAACRGAE